MTINYNRSQSERGGYITPQLATELLQRHLNPLFQVTDVRKLYGGSISRVLEFTLDREPGALVAKVNDQSESTHYAAEMQSLRYLRENTHFPVPIPFAFIEHDPAYDGTMLILQKIKGRTLEGAELSSAGKHFFQIEFGAVVAELHRFEAVRFGPAATKQPYDNWIDYYGPMAEEIADKARDLLPSSERPVLDHVVKYLDQWLNHKPTPTLIHGDLWANNIMIDDAHPDRPRILSFLDTVASYADPEYELAYLQLFGTAGETFFDIYARFHDIDPGYKRRSRIYWLITLLQHAGRYGNQYIPQCERLTKEIRRMTR
ncbi:MAG: fructosamine kinase family protein [Phycisphaeraceae bacterium]